MTENVPPPNGQLAAQSAALPKSTPIVRLLRPQGRRGELLAEPLTNVPGLLEPGRRISLPAIPGSAALDTTIESAWAPTGRNAGRIVLKLAGIDSISAAELLAGRELHIPAADLPALDPDTWFVRDLIGCQLFNGPTLVGEITGVEYSVAPDGRTRLSDAAPLLEVTTAADSQRNLEAPAADTDPDPDPALIPFIKSWLDSVDIPHKRIVMHLPPGLVDPAPESR